MLRRGTVQGERKVMGLLMQKRKGAEPQIRVIFDLSRWHLPGVWWVRNLEQSGSGESMGIRDKTPAGTTEEQRAR